MRGDCGKTANGRCSQAARKFSGSLFARSIDRSYCRVHGSHSILGYPRAASAGRQWPRGIVPKQLR